MSNRACSQEQLDLLAQSPLFQGLSAGELESVLQVLHARVASFSQGELVQRLGEPFLHVGVVMAGVLESSFGSASGNPQDLGRFGAGDTYGVALACACSKVSPLQLEALEPSEVMLLEVGQLMDEPAKESDEVGRLREMALRNLLLVVSKQAVRLNQRAHVLGQRSLRERIVVFLQGLPQDSRGFYEVPLSRERMASAIGANRSAMSRELGRMQDEGLLQVDGRLMKLLE